MALEEEKMAVAKAGLEEVEKRCRANLNQMNVFNTLLHLDWSFTTVLLEEEIKVKICHEAELLNAIFWCCNVLDVLR